MMNRLRSMTMVGSKSEDKKKLPNDTELRKRRALAEQAESQRRDEAEQRRELLMKEYLSLYRQGPLPTTNNSYVQYVLTLVDLFRKMWESHLEWTTNHILNHIAIEMAMGEVLFAKDDDTSSDDVNAVRAAHVLEYALSVARFRYLSCKRNVKIAEMEMKKCLKGGDEKSSNAAGGLNMNMGMDLHIRGSRGGDRKTDMTAVISRSLNSVSVAVYDLLYKSTMEASLQPREDRSGLRPSKKQDEEEREMMEAFGDVWIACEEPLLSALELLWPAAGVEAETEVNDAMLMSAIFGVSSSSGRDGGSPGGSTVGSMTSIESPDGGGRNYQDRLRSSLLYGLVKGQCLQALMRCADNLRFPQIDLTPLHTPSDTPRGAASVSVSVSTYPTYLSAPKIKASSPFPWQVYHRTMDLVHAKVAPDDIHGVSALADSAMYASRLLPISAQCEDEGTDADVDMDSVDHEADGNSRPSTQEGGGRFPSSSSTSSYDAPREEEPELGQSRQWAALVEALWGLREELPRPLPALPSYMAGSDSVAAMVYPYAGAYRGDEESKRHSPRQIRSQGYTTHASGSWQGQGPGPGEGGAEFVEEADDVLARLSSPRHEGNTSVWATSTKTGKGSRDLQRQEARGVSQAYADATKEQIEFYEAERQQSQQRELARRKEELDREKEEYARRMQRFTLERMAARVSLDVVDSVYVEALVRAMEARGVQFLGRGYFRDDQDRRKQEAMSGSGSGGEGEGKAEAQAQAQGAQGQELELELEPPFRGPPRGWTQTPAGGGADAAASWHESHRPGWQSPGGGTAPYSATNTHKDVSSSTTSTQRQSCSPQPPLPASTLRESSAAGAPSPTVSLAGNPSAEPSVTASMLVQVPRRLGSDQEQTAPPDDRSEGSDGASRAAVDPTNIAAHGHLAYLPSDSGLSQDFNVSHGTQYYDPLEDVVRGPNPEDRDARSIVGQGDFAHHLDPFATGRAVDALAEDSLTEYRFNTTQLTHGDFIGGTSMAFEEGLVGKDAFLDIGRTAAASVSSGLSHPYRRHLAPSGEAGGDTADFSRSLVTMELPAGTEQGMHDDFAQPEGDTSWVVGDVTEAVSAELSHVSKVFPLVTSTSDGSGVDVMQAEAHWSLSLRSLPALTETRSFHTSQGITLTYTPMDSRPELRQLEWRLRPNQLPALAPATSVSSLPAREGQLHSRGHAGDGERRGKFAAHGGSTSPEKAQGMSDFRADSSASPSGAFFGGSLVDSSIATGSMGQGIDVPSPDSRAAMPTTMTGVSGAPRSVLEYANDETLVAYLDPTDPTVRNTQLLQHPEQALQGSIRRARREDDDATIDHIYVNNEEYDNQADYLPFDVDPADDESLLSEDLRTVSTFYSDAPHLRAEMAARARQQRQGGKQASRGVEVEEEDEDADFEDYKFFDAFQRPVETALLSKENVRAHSAQVHRYDHDQHDNQFQGSEVQGTRFGVSLGDDGDEDDASGFRLPSVQEEGLDGPIQHVKESRAGEREVVYRFVPGPIRVRPSPVVLAPPLDPTSIDLRGHSSERPLQRHNLLASRVVSGLSDGASASASLSPQAIIVHPLLRHEPRVGRSHHPQFRLRAKGARWKAVDGTILFGPPHSPSSGGEGADAASRIAPIIEWPEPDDAEYPTQLRMKIPDPNERDGFPVAGQEDEDGRGEVQENRHLAKEQLCARAYDSSVVKKPSRTPLRGRYLYDPPAGTILGAGHHSLSLIFIPEDFATFRSAEFKAYRTIYVAKGTPVLEYTPIHCEDILIAGTPLPDKYFECSVKAGDVTALQQMRDGVPVCDGAAGPWVGLQLPTAEHRRLHLEWKKGLEAIRAKVAAKEHSRRHKLALARKAVREHQQERAAQSGGDEQALVLAPSSDDEEDNDDVDDDVDEEAEVPSGEEPDYQAMLADLKEELRGMLAAEVEALTTGEFLFSHRRGDALERGKHRNWCQYRPSAFLNKHYKFGYASIPFEVGARAPKMYWADILPIDYLTPLSTRQLKAMVAEEWPVEPVHNSPASLPPNHAGKGWGSVRYDPANDIGAVLEVGKHTLWAYFEPFDPLVFRKTKVSVELEVLQVPSEIVWTLPAPIYDGHPVSEAQLNARAEVPDSRDKRQGGGSFSYDVAVGTVLPLGEYPVSVTFTPDHPHRYTTVTVKSTLRVLRPREPTLHWPELEEIRYPAPLGRIELCVRVSSLNCTGKFVYDPPLNAVLDAGTRTLSCTFVPDLPQWCSTTITTSLVVLPARPRLRWPEPGSIIHGSAIKEHLLCAEASNVGLRKENCRFTYKPPINTVLDLGSHTLTAYFEAINEDAQNYEKGEVTCTLVVRQRPKKRTTVTWPPRVPSLRHPEKLTTSEHLNAVCSEAKGMFVFTPNPGTSLNVGTHELKCKFYPENSDYYMVAEAKSKITVTKGGCSLNYTLAHEDCFFEYGRPLDRRILSAACVSQIGTAVPGNYEYFLNGRPLDGAEKNEEAQRLDAGSHRITCRFTPSVAANWDAPEEKSVDIFVERVTPVLKWPKPSTAVYPAVLTAKDHLTCFVETEHCTGTFSYSHEPTTVEESDEEDEQEQEQGEEQGDGLSGHDEDDASRAFAFPATSGDGEQGGTDSKHEHKHKSKRNKAGTDEKAPDRHDGGVSPAKKREKVGLLKAGKHHLKCRFTPDDPVNFYGGDKSTVWEIEKGEIPLISWKMKSSKLVYGEALDPGLHFTCIVDHPSAEYQYYPPAGTKLPVGNYKIRCRVTIAGEEADCYEPLTVRASVEVIPMTPVLDFPGAPEDELSYGEPLSLDRHLNAKLRTKGYAPSDISLLGVRDRKREEEERAEAEKAMTKVQIKETRARLRVEEEELEAAKQAILDIADEVADHEANMSSVGGAESPEPSLSSSIQKQKARFRAALQRGYVYTPKPGTLLPAGTHTIHCYFEPPDESVNIGKSARVSTTVTVRRSVPKITWKAPASLKYGMPLTETELNACIAGPLKAVSEGTFTYNPPLGTVLPVGEHKLSVVFQPKAVDSVDRVSRRVAINVFKVYPRFTWGGAPTEVPKGYRMTAEDLCAACVGIDGEPLSGKYVYTPSFGNVIGAPGKREIRVEFLLKGEAQNLYFKPKPIVIEVDVAKS